MFFLSLTIYKNIIQVNDNKLNSKCAMYVGKTKGHDQPFTKLIRYLKVIFHSSLTLNLIWWYPLRINLPEGINSGQHILKSWNRELIFDGDWLIARQALHILQLPSFLRVNRAGTEGLTLSPYKPFSNNSLTWLLNSAYLTRFIYWIGKFSIFNKSPI